MRRPDGPGRRQRERGAVRLKHPRRHGARPGRRRPPTRAPAPVETPSAPPAATPAGPQVLAHAGASRRGLGGVPACAGDPRDRRRAPVCHPWPARCASQRAATRRRRAAAETGCRRRAAAAAEMGGGLPQAPPQPPGLELRGPSPSTRGCVLCAAIAEYARGCALSSAVRREAAGGPGSSSPSLECRRLHGEAAGIHGQGGDGAPRGSSSHPSAVRLLFTAAPHWRHPHGGVQRGTEGGPVQERASRDADTNTERSERQTGMHSTSDANGQFRLPNHKNCS